LAIDLIMGSNIQKIVCKIKEFPWAFNPSFIPSKCS
jgi:hypothetical protein